MTRCVEIAGKDWRAAYVGEKLRHDIKLDHVKLIEIRAC